MSIQVEEVFTPEIIRKSPSSWSVLRRELVRDKTALVSIAFVVLFLIFIYSSVLFVNQDVVTTVDLGAIREAPSSAHWLGTDRAGRDIFGQLVIGARNSFTIGFTITLLSAAIGLTLGLLVPVFMAAWWITLSCGSLILSWCFRF